MIEILNHVDQMPFIRTLYYHWTKEAYTKVCYVTIFCDNTPSKHHGIICLLSVIVMKSL